ncbi:hypothetical protein RhiirA5_497817 [Rhizophagus irregularis]|uniref:Ion transport domain-containing protein n=1 Tax=Rhizophagus irregularis TaxID=588596 RepID=A0A2N0PWS9_9GLOM|nr:hypothetical protein RhiirA5_497817 [Rhizophagus irregularis]
MEKEISDKDHKNDDDIEVASLNEVIVKSTAEKMEIDNSRDAHDGEKISSVSISPNGTYAVTYCGEDNSIEGWIIEDSKLVLNSKSPFKLSDSFYILTEKSIRNKVNNSKIVCCYTRDNYSELLGYDDKDIKIEVYQMASEPRLVKLNPPIKFWPDSYEWPIFNFRKNNDLIIFQSNILSVYSQNNKINGNLILKSSSRLSGRIIGLTIDVDNDNIWAISDNYLFKWDFETLELKFNMKDKDLTIISKANLTIVKYYNEIVIFSKDVHYPIRKIQTEISNIKVKLLYDSQNYYLLVFNMPKKDEKQNIFLYHPKSKVAIGLVNGRFSCINLSNKKWHEFFDKEIEESSTPFEKDVCNDTLLVPDMENIKSLFLKKRTIIYTFKMLEFKDKKYHWRILKEGNGYVLSVLDSNGVSCSKKVIPRLSNSEILGNNALVIRLDNYQLIIFEYDHDNKEIKGKYYFKVEPLFGNILPITDINTVGVCKKNTDFYAIWSEMIISLIEDDKYFEKYGATLLPMLIKSNDPKSAHYIKEIYNKCIELVKKDLKRNLKLLNIITSSMYDLYKKYPDYLTQFNSEMFLVLDPYPEKINNNSNEYYSHFHTFTQEIDNNKIFKLRQIIINWIIGIYTFTTLQFKPYDFSENFDDFDDNYDDDDDDDDYTYYNIFNIFRRLCIGYKLIIDKYKEIHPKWYILYTIGIITLVPILILLFVIFPIFSEILNIISIYTVTLTAYLLISPFMIVYLVYIYSDKERIAKQCIIFIVPYINYSCYPSKYNWWKEIIYPPSNSFIKTCKKEFYTNWNGEAVIDFKWKKFGRLYYFIIWLIFIVFLICFTIASYPTNSLSQEIRIKLYKTSIAFGFFHLIFELRQFIWNPKKYLNIWNAFDLSAYLSVTITSIYLIKYDNVPDWALSVSCLLLDLKFLLFFRIFEYFGIYFAIIIGVAKRIFSFLIMLAIIIASFAHAFFLLLHPQEFINSVNVPNSNDPNNPWTLSSTFIQVDENGNPLNQTFIQVPDENTNLFYSYPTSLLAVYLFLTGDQNSLSLWTPKNATENTVLFLLMVIFSFLIVIYLMNLFIGLLNMAIEEDNNKASYLAQKAEAIAEIELFYLLPFQRRWRTWFPEMIYYTAGVVEARTYINKAKEKGDWKKKDWREMKDKILEHLGMEDKDIEED